LYPIPVVRRGKRSPGGARPARREEAPDPGRKVDEGIAEDHQDIEKKKYERMFHQHSISRTKRDHRMAVSQTLKSAQATGSNAPS